MTKKDTKKIGIIEKLNNRIQTRRFTYLTVSLLLLITAYPYVQGDMGGQIILSLLATLVMITSVIAVGDRKRHTVIALILAAPWFLLLLLKFPFIPIDSSVLIKDEIFFAFLLFAYTTYRIFVHIIKSREITAEILSASICVYLLLGLTWTTMYVIINIFYPGSFIDTDGSAVQDGPDFLFFSYVTLTTVGYGNIEAITDQARSLASIEALCGQLYLTIMVARLVGLHISKPANRKSAV